MANMSSASGTISFTHTNPNTDPSIIEQLVAYSMEHFYYGYLLFPERYGQLGSIDPEEWTWQWGETYDFESEGRWSFNSTLSNYFDGIEDAELNKALEGLILNAQYVDYEPGVGFLVKDNVTIKAVRNDDGTLTTEIMDIKSNDIEMNADNLVGYHISDWAMDSTTEMGVMNFANFAKEYITENPNAYPDNKDLTTLLTKIDRIPTQILLTAFNDHDVSFVTDYEPDDDFYITETFIEKAALTHPLFEPFIR